MIPAVPLTVSLCLFGSHLASEETTASTLAFELRASPGLNASKIDVESDFEASNGDDRLLEPASWAAFVREATADSRAMTDEERWAVDDFFLSQFDDDVRGSRKS